MENFILRLASERGEIVAAVVAVTVILGAFVIKRMGWFLPETGQSATGSQVNDLSEKVGAMDRRILQLENDVGYLPTRSELHQIEKQIVGLDGKMTSLEKTGNASSTALGRIEDHLYNWARKAK